MKYRLLSLFLSAIAVSTAVAANPDATRLPRSSPEAQGISSASLLAFLDAAEQKLDALHNFILVRHGHVVIEAGWAPYSPDKTHILHSLTKSFTSTAVGFAVTEGKLNVDDPVLKFFPEDAPANPSAELKAMRVRHLLTMSTGHVAADINAFPYRGRGAESRPNLVKAFFAMPITSTPGTKFEYDTAASHMLSLIVQKVTGQTVQAYLEPRLFRPLGFRDFVWEKDFNGSPFGGFGLHMHLEDIAKFGQLYLQKGKWQGRQLIPAAWIEEATSKQMDNSHGTNSDWEQGYGYQFWRCRHGFYRGDGKNGQFCIVMQQYDTVVAINSGTDDMASVMNLVWDMIVPALKDSPLPENSADAQKLAAKVGSLKLVHDNGIGGF